MKNYLPLVRIFACFFFFLFSQIQLLPAQCVNADFENGNLTGWTGTWGDGVCSGPVILGICTGSSYPDAFQYNGFNQGPNNTPPSTLLPEQNHFIMTSGYDDIIGGTALPVVHPSGSYSLRLGNSQAIDGGESVSYTFTVTPNNCNFTYHYAVVVNDGGHGPGDQAYFKIRMWDGNNVPIDCATYDVDATTAPAIGGFTVINNLIFGDVFYKPWTSVFIPLNNFMGQTVRIQFETRDCDSDGGSHFAYAYIDADCAPLQIISSAPNICGGQSVTLTAPAGAATYQWTGPGVVPPGNTQQATVTLAGHYTVTMTTLATVPCIFSMDTIIPGSPGNPIANFSATTVCAGTPTTFTDFSQPAGLIGTWAWDFDNNSVPDATTQNPTHTFPAAGTYPVRLVVAQLPCIDDTTINVVVTASPTSTFTATTPLCAGQNSTITYTGNAPTSATYTWNFDGGTVVSGSGQGPYQVNWSTSGVKNVTLTVAIGSCVSSVTSVPVTINLSPSLTLSPDVAICTGGSTTLTASGATSYSWSPGTGLSGTTGSSVTANPTLTTTYAVTATTAGCTATGTVTVSVSGTPTSDFTATSPVCIGANSVITYTGNAPASATYTWNFDGGTVASGSGQGPYSVNWSTSGVKSITLAVAVGSCISSVTTVQVTVDNATGITITPSNPSVCLGGSVVLTANGGTSYLWSPSTGLSDTTSSTVTAAPIVTTTYTVTGIGSSCSSPVTVTVSVNPVPTSTFTTISPVCTGQNSTITYTGNASVSATYTWFFTGGTIASGSGQGPYDVNWSTPGTQIVTLQVTENGCTSPPTDLSVTVTSGPTATFTVTSPVCIGQNSTIAYTGGASGSATYIWNFDSGTVVSGSGQGPYSVNWSTTGTKNITLSVSENQCFASSSVSVVVGSVVATFNASSPVCAGQNSTITYTGNATPSATYTWNFDGGNIATGTGQGPYSVNWSTTGTKNITLSVDENGCTSSVSATVDVYPLPVVNFTADTVIGCENFPVCFTDNSASNNPSVYLWNFGNGAVSNLQNPCFSYVAPGIYTVSLQVTSADGCSSTSTVPDMITVVANPVAAFTTGGGNTFFYGTAINLVNLSQNAISYFWTFGNGNTSANVSPTVTYPAPGTYTITLDAYNQLGCPDSTQLDILVFEPESFFIPNIFTPNGDGNNDFFNIQTRGNVVVWEFEVFNRWGEKVHENIYAWDGTFKGKASPPGVYVYQFKLGLTGDTQSILRKGSVTLVR